MEKPPIEAWPGLDILDSLDGGSRVSTFRGEYAGIAVVVRRSLRSTAAIDWELELLDHLSHAGVRVPEIIPSVDGLRHVSGWHMYRYIPGRVAGHRDLATLHESAKQVHGATAGWTQRPGFRDAATLISRNRGGDIDLQAVPADLAARIRAAWEAVQPQPSAVVHGDLGPGNTIITPDGDVALIDWDEARADDPGFDTGITPKWRTAQLAWEIATCWSKEPEYASNLASDFLQRSPDQP